jgi:hypothetical protein
VLSCGRSPFTNKDYQPNSTIQSNNTLEGAIVFGQADVVIRPYWRVGPVVGDECKLLLVLSDKQGHPKNPPNNFSIFLWMPTMGHASYPVTLNRIADGVYEANDIYFTMDGLWQIHFELSDQGRMIEEVKWSLTL